MESLGKGADVSCFWEVWVMAKFGEKKRLLKNRLERTNEDQLPDWLFGWKWLLESVWRLNFAFSLISCHLTLLYLNLNSSGYKKNCTQSMIKYVPQDAYIKSLDTITHSPSVKWYQYYCYMVITLIIYSMYLVHYFKCTLQLTRHPIFPNITRLNKSNFIKQKSILSSSLQLKLMM